MIPVKPHIAKGAQVASLEALLGVCLVKPQHFTPPNSVSAQVWFFAAETAVALEGVFGGGGDKPMEMPRSIAEKSSAITYACCLEMNESETKPFVVTKPAFTGLLGSEMSTINNRLP